MSDLIDCYTCDGTGIDETSWDGRCPFCKGSGEVDVPDDEDADQDWDYDQM